MVKVTVAKSTGTQSYEVPQDAAVTIQEALHYIKENLDPGLEFDSGCRSGVCGCCGVRVNEREKLACQSRLEEQVRIEPLRYHEVIKDLRVKRHEETLGECYLHEYSQEKITGEDAHKIELQSDCILCGSCYSACPVYEVNKSFLGPFALTRVLKYVEDRKEADKKSFIDGIQTNGVWDCTLCGECSAVCPQGISSKDDINVLRAKSVQAGYSDPNFQTMDFGFNPGF